LFRRWPVRNDDDDGDDDDNDGDDDDNIRILMLFSWRGIKSQQRKKRWEPEISMAIKY